MGGDDYPPQLGVEALMRRLFYAGVLTEEIEITGGDAHHLARVMRAQIGDEVVVADSDGQTARMRVSGIDRDAVRLHLVEYMAPEVSASTEVILVQALLKGEKMDFVVQKAVELGASALYPIETEHVVVRYDAKKAAAKSVRWQKIADEAAKQCGRSALMRVAAIAPLFALLQDAALFDTPDTAVVFCYEAEHTQSMRTVLRSVDARRIVLIVGAEGGFSPTEAATIRAAGAQSVSLGRLILRAETAALAALAVTQYELGNFAF